MAGKPWYEDLQNLFYKMIIPNFYGALLLLFFSVFFGSINFFSALPENRQSIRASYKYYICWIGANYTFALILLILILPDDVKMSEVNKGLLIYSLIATALPELSANIRLRFGKSEYQAFDLYRYKQKISELITHKMEKSFSEEQKKDLRCIESCFAEKLPEFRNRLENFIDQLECSKDEKQEARERLEARECTSCRELLHDYKSSPSMKSQLVDFFREDIRIFRNSPAYALCTTLHPMLDVQDSRKLVRNGITTSAKFLRRTYWGYQRKKLAEQTGIPLDRIREIHFSTLALLRRKRISRIKMAVFCIVGLAVVINLISWQTKRSLDRDYTGITLEATLPPETKGASVDHSGTNVGGRSDIPVGGGS